MTPHELSSSSPGQGTDLVAIVDDDPTARRLMQFWLEKAGFRTVEHSTGHSALNDDGEIPTIACIDLGLGDVSGLEVLERFHARDADLPLIVVTAQREVEVAVEAMRRGAYDYVTKPLDSNQLLHSVARARERRDLVRNLRRLESALGERHVHGAIVGESPCMQELAHQVSRVLDTDVPVCLFGEGGTGKQLVARAIHNGGTRQNGPFVAVSCASIPEALQESELFGHERGAFTGATQQRKGRIEEAHGGTLLLDNVGALSLSAQIALLRTLQERTFRRVGGTQDIAVNVRIVCTTSDDLKAAVREGRFREDLYFRLVVYPIPLPPLREHREDIPLLVGHFLRKLREDVGRAVERVDPEVLEALSHHNWPGNVRELQNIVHRSLLACHGDRITIADLPQELRRLALPQVNGKNGVNVNGNGHAGHPSDEEVIPLRELERRAIEKALRVTRGSVSKAAKLLGIGRATLYRRLASLELPHDSA